MRWVRLLDGEPQCDQEVVVEKRAPGRWLLGRVEQVLVPVEDAGGRTPVVLQFDEAVECESLAGTPQSGLLGDERAVRGMLTPTLLGRLRGPAPLVLAVGDSPATATKTLAIGAVMLLGSAWMAVQFALRMRSRHRGPTGTT